MRLLSISSRQNARNPSLLNSHFGFEVMLWIISGPSSAGKSTFLASPRCREITELGPEAQILFGFSLNGPSAQPLEGDLFLHYNLLRPASQFARQRRHAQRSLAGRVRGWLGFRARGAWEQTQEAAAKFRADPAWAEAVALPGPKRAVVLVASRDRILERVRSRRQIEPHLAEAYDPDEWLALYDSLDLPRLYRAWYQELRSLGIEPLLLDSHDAAFRSLAAPE